MTRSQVLFIGGRSGVGKTSLASELHALLSAADIKHCVIEGDALDLAHPPPWEFGLAERNLTAIWRNYRALGYRRLIYTNTVSVLEIASLTSAMGDDPLVTAVLLTASDETASRRLRQREQGSALHQHLERSIQRATELDHSTPSWVYRLNTDGQNIEALARQTFLWTGWTSTDPES